MVDVERDLSIIWSNRPAQAWSARTGDPGPCPYSFWLSPGMKTLQPLFVIFSDKISSLCADLKRRGTSHQQLFKWKKKGHTNMKSKKTLTFLGFALLTPQSLVIYKNLHKDFIKWFFTPKETLLFLWKWIINPQKFLKLKPVAICYWGSDGFFSVTNCLLRYYIFTYPVAFIWEI